MVFHVRNMSRADFEFAVHITNLMGWGLVVQDFEFMMELEPEGCFVLLEDSDTVGIATTVSYGKLGWFGNLIVTENKRNRGAGTLLVKHALKYLTEKNVQTVGLYAYTERIPFYRRLGFECDSEFIVLKGKGFSSSVRANVRKAEKQQLGEIIAFDQSCFGASRRKMLEPILMDRDNLCFASTEDGHVSGFAAAKVYRGLAELGPLECKRGKAKTTADLLRATFNALEGLETSVFVPKKEKAIVSMLMQSGFHEEFRVEKMFHGPSIPEDCVYMAESLERG
jgi:N-acetylglutamate synthase-like GNAT family acetyltransferase